MNNLKINELIVNKLNELNLTISTCESMTGGALASSLVMSEHASNSFLGSLVTYSPNSKIKFAKVSEQTIKEFGTISVECARQMAINTQRSLNSDIAVAVVGNASKANPMENKPFGLAYVCIVMFDKTYDLKFTTTYDNRQDVIRQCAAFCLNQIWQLIKDLKK